MASKGALIGSDIPNRIRYRLRRMLSRNYRISDGRFGYVFRCEEWIETVRARTLLTKEPGTVAWISETVGEGDVFYDVGANVGLYTVLAGKRVGKSGAVVAFEPHLGNGIRLLQNIGLNGIASRTIMLSTALHDQEGFIPFYYRSNSSGSSDSQLGNTVSAYGETFSPESTELKFAESIDGLLARGALPRSPTHIKVDVDGNEIRILNGMRGLLAGDKGPTWIQVEVSAKEWLEVNSILNSCGYALEKKSYTALSEKKMKDSGSSEAEHFNALFKRMPRT